MIFKAVLENPTDKDMGEVTIPFPISADRYDHDLDLVAQMGMGGVKEQDCQVTEIDGAYPILKRLEGGSVNLDELDYLAKRLDSFTDQEAAQFQAAAVKLGISGVKDFINLTFCGQQTTVITDFSDLEKVGKSHYMNLRGGCAPIKELEQLDARQFALSLICNSDGYVTPYGVIYDNGMELEELYDGIHFPCYLYDETELILEVPSQTEGNALPTWLYLPMPESQIKRLLERDCLSPESAGYKITDSGLSPKVRFIAEQPESPILELNKMCAAISALDKRSRTKLDAVIEMAEPEYPCQVEQLAKNLDLFDFVPNIGDAEEYGRYLIQESDHFDYDENLEDYYNYRTYGQDKVDRESGLFVPEGYVAYQGELGLEELMIETSEEQSIEMGGIQ